MELELGLKITRTREDVSSSVDFHFSKDPFGPLVLSHETDSRFIIIIHLKGFKKEGIEIDINKEGNRITVRGRKPVEEMVMIRWMAWRNEVEFRVFRKVFRIPDIVDLDKIKARFDDDDATLTITMPKRVKGVSGLKIEEEKEEERVDFGDVSEAGEVEEESLEREESDEHSEKEIQREEEFGERETLEEEQKIEEETEDDNLQNIHHIDEQDKILECIQEYEEELADSNKESEDSSLRQLPDSEAGDSQEHTRHEEQELVLEQQTKTKNDDFGSRAFEEIGDLEPDVLDTKTKSGAMGMEMTDDDADGLSTVQEIEEPERHNEENKIREMREQRDEEETEDDNLDKIHQIDDQDYKILECREKKQEEEESPGLQELADSNTESEDSSLRKLPDIEGRDSHEQTRHKEKVNKVVEQQDSQAESNSDDFGSRAFEEIEEQEPDEQLDKTSESGSTKKKTMDDDGDGLRKVQGIEEAERHTEERKNQEMVEGETGGHEKKKNVKMEFKNRDAKEEVDGKLGEGFTPNIDRTQVVGEDDIAETHTKAKEFEFDKLQEDKVHKIHGLVEKKEEKGGNAKVRRKSEEKILTKLQENEEQSSKGQKPLSKQENTKEMMEEKTPEAGENIGNDIPKPVQETEVPKVDTLRKTGDEGKEKKTNVNMEIKNGDAEDVNAKMGEGFTQNNIETARKAEHVESDKLKTDEIDKIQKLVEKKEEEENDKAGTQTEDISLRKLEEIGEIKFEGQKRYDKQEIIKELAEEQTPEAETNIGNDTLKPVQEIEVPEETCDKGKEGKEGKEEKKIVKMETKNGDAKEEVDVKMGKGFTANIAETEIKAEVFESEKPKADEVDKIQKLVKKKEKVDENPKVGTQREDIGERQFQGQKLDDKENIKRLVEEQTPEADTNIGNDILEPIQERCAGKQKIQKKFQEETKDQPEECKEKVMETWKRINNADTRKGLDIRKQELDEASRCDKESKTRELVKSKTTNEEKNEKEIAETEKKEEEEIAEEKTEFGDDDDDDILRKVRDIHQCDSDTMKGQEVKDMIQELVLEEKECDGSKGIIAVAKTKAENDKSKKVQEIYEQLSHEEDTCGKQFQKLIGGDTSGHGGVEDVEKEEETQEAGKRICDSLIEAQDIGKKDSDVSEEEKKDEADKPEKKTSMIEQELVSLNSQLELDNVEDGEKTQELVEEKIRDCKENKGSEASKTKTDDDVARKFLDIKEQELYEPKREHISKARELLKEKTGDHEKEEENGITESQIEAETGILRTVDGSEEQELHEPKIHKERDKTRSTGGEEPSGEEKEEDEENIVEFMKITENENSTDIKDFEEERPYKPESHEKRYKIQEVVKAEHNGCKEEKQEEKVTAKAELETEKESSKKVQENEKQEYDGLKGSMVQEKMQETEEIEKTSETKEKKIVERRKKTKDDSLKSIRDDEELELSKTYQREKKDKIQELVEMGTSDYREKVKKQEEADRPDIDEFERHGEPRNIPQLVGEELQMENIAELRWKMEDDSSGKFYEFEEVKLKEDWTHEEQEGRKDLAKEEVTDPKDKHTFGEGHNDHKEKQQVEKVIAKEELKTEEYSAEKVQVIGKHEIDELKMSMVQDKMQETKEEGKNRTIEEKEVVKRKTKTIDGSLRKVGEGEYPQLGRHKIHGEEDMMQELVEAELSDHKEKIKKKYEDDISRSQETGKLDLGELERHFKQRKIHQSVEDEKGEGKVENIPQTGGKMKGDSSGEFHEFQKQKSYEDWRQEESKEIENFVKEEATDPKDKLTGGEGEHEEERYDKVAETMTKVEGKINKNAGENKEAEPDKQEQYRKLDKLEGIVVREAANDCRRRENLMDDLTTKIQETEKEENLVDDFKTKTQETEKEESHELEMHEKLYIVSDLEEYETGDQEDEEAEEASAVVASNESGSSRKIQTIEEESEKHKEQNKIPETSDPEVKEEDEKRVAKKRTEELEARFQELEGKTEKDKVEIGEGRRGEKGKKGKTVETTSHEKIKTKSDDGDVRKNREAKMKESNESENQEREGKTEELERKEPSNQEVKPVTEYDTLGVSQEFLEKESYVSKRRPVEEERIQELRKVEKQDQVNENENGNEEKAEAETKIDDGKSRMFEISKMLELDESKENEEPMEEKSTDPETEKEGNEKIAQGEIDSRIEDQEIQEQESYELLKSGEYDKIPQYHREEEKGMEQREIEEIQRTAEDVSSRKIQQIESQEPDELDKHQKLREIQEICNLQESVEEESREHGEEEMNEGGGYKAALQPKSIASSQSQDIEVKRSYQPKRYAEQELMTEEDGNEYRREGEKNEKAKKILQVESKFNDDSSVKNETEIQESTGLRGEKKKENQQELREIETSDQRKSETEEEEVERAETINENDFSRKIHEHEERKSDQMCEKLAEEETRDDKETKEGNRAGKVLGKVETKIGKVRDIREQKQVVVKDTSSHAKGKKNQETKSRVDSSGKKTQENEKQESHEQKKIADNLGLVGKKTNYCRNEEDRNEDKENEEAEVPRDLKRIEKRESSTKMVEQHENQDKIEELVEKKMNNQEGEDNKSMITEVLEKAEDHESKGPEGLSNQDKSREQRLRDKLKDEETAKTETNSKNNESRKMHQIKEQETSEQGRINELVENRTHDCREKESMETKFEDGNSKNIQEIDKEESLQPQTDEKREKIQERVDSETSEDDEEELEVEFEEEEEDWEAEVIQEMDSDEDIDKIKQIKRIRLGFRLVGGSTLFMSLIVIVNSFIRSKRKIRCYKF